VKLDINQSWLIILSNNGNSFWGDTILYVLRVILKKRKKRVKTRLLAKKSR